MYEAVVMDGSGGVFGSGKITCRWFNMPYIHKLVASGHEVIVYGKVKESNGRLIIDHPEFEIIRECEAAGESIHLERIVPIYRNVSGFSQRRLREIMHLLLLRCDPESLAARAGTGEQVGRIRVGQAGSKERVVFDNVIGDYVDPTGAASPTRVGIIHYSKDAVHIVPGRPQ